MIIPKYNLSQIKGHVLAYKLLSRLLVCTAVYWWVFSIWRMCVIIVSVVEQL